MTTDAHEATDRVEALVSVQDLTRLHELTFVDIPALSPGEDETGLTSAPIRSDRVVAI